MDRPDKADSPIAGARAREFEEQAARFAQRQSSCGSVSAARGRIAEAIDRMEAAGRSGSSVPPGEKRSQWRSTCALVITHLPGAYVPKEAVPLCAMVVRGTLGMSFVFLKKALCESYLDEPSTGDWQVR